MSPNGGGEPTGAIATAIKQTFGSFDAFKAKFNDAGTKRFGSGWVWLVRNKAGKLEITTTANQDTSFHGGQLSNYGQRCLGTRLLSQIPKLARRLLKSLVECC